MEEALRHAAAPDIERVRQQGLVACRADDELRRAAADIRHQQRFAGEIRSSAQERQRRLARPGDDLRTNAVFRQLRHEFIGVAGIARRRGGRCHHADGRRARLLPCIDALPVPRYLVCHAPDGLRPQCSAGIHALPQVRDGIPALQDIQMAVGRHVRQQQTARHGSDIDCGIALRFHTPLLPLMKRQGPGGNAGPMVVR